MRRKGSIRRKINRHEARAGSMIESPQRCAGTELFLDSARLTSQVPAAAKVPSSEEGGTD